MVTRATNGRYSELSARIERLDVKIDKAIADFRAEYVDGHTALGAKVDMGFNLLKDQILALYTSGPFVDSRVRIASVETKLDAFPKEFITKEEMVNPLAMIADHEKALKSMKKMFWVMVGPAIAVGLRMGYDVIAAVIKHVFPT